MTTKFRLGLVSNSHLRQLVSIVDYSRETFSSRPPVQDFFSKLKHVLECEQIRREEKLEDEWYEIEADFDLSSVNPVALIFLEEFFHEKAENFAQSEPPVSSFFSRLADVLSDYLSREVPDSVFEEVTSARNELSV